MYNVHCVTVQYVQCLKWPRVIFAWPCYLLEWHPCLMWLWYHPLGSSRARASCLLSFIVFYCNDLGSDSEVKVEEIINQFPFIDLLPCDRKSIKYFTNVYMYTVIVLSFSVVFLDLVTLSGRDSLFLPDRLFQYRGNGQGRYRRGLDGVWNKQSHYQLIRKAADPTWVSRNSENTKLWAQHSWGALWLGVIQKWGMDPKPSQIASDDWPWIQHSNNENDLWTL